MQHFCIKPFFSLYRMGQVNIAIIQKNKSSFSHVLFFWTKLTHANEALLVTLRRGNYEIENDQAISL